MTIKKATALFLIFLLLFTFSLSLVPGHNGDMPFYIAAVFSREGSTDTEALLKAKEVIRKEMTAKESADHIDRLDHAEKNLLDFYRIKPLYVYVVAAIHQVGVPFILSTLIPSLISFFLIGWILFTWSANVLRPFPALIFSVLLLVPDPSIVLARLSSPDPLSNLFLFACFYRIFFEKDSKWTFLLLLISLFIRLDNLIAVLVLLTMMKCWPDRDSKTHISTGIYLFVAVFYLATTVWINFYFEKDFWWFTKISYIRDIHSYGRQVLVYFLSLSQSLFPALLLLGMLAVFTGMLKNEMKSVHMLLAIGAIFFFRFLLFPSFEERFQAAFYLAGFLVLIKLFFKEQISNRPIFELQNPGPPGRKPD
jgi:hypothetical protein